MFFTLWNFRQYFQYGERFIRHISKIFEEYSPPQNLSSHKRGIIIFSSSISKVALFFLLTTKREICNRVFLQCTKLAMLAFCITLNCENWMDVVVNHLNFNSIHHDKGKVALILIPLVTNLFSSEVVQMPTLCNTGKLE